MSSYLETCRYLQTEGAYESHGSAPPPPVDSETIEGIDGADEMESAAEQHNSPPPPMQPRRYPSRQRTPLHEVAERTVFTEEGKPGQYLVLKVSGEWTDDMLEALEDFVKRQRRRLQSQ